MTENLKKFEETLRKDEKLRARFAAEFKRIAEEKSAGNDAEAYVKAAKALGYDFSMAEVEKASAEAQVLDPEELDKVTGGRYDEGWCIDVFGCYLLNRHDTPDKEGYPCFANYDCITLYHH